MSNPDYWRKECQAEANENTKIREVLVRLEREAATRGAQEGPKS